jgi:hypothetical protein
MGERRVYVYRVVVDKYPEGSREPGWRPECWQDPEPGSLLVPSALRELGKARLRRALAKREFRWPVPKRRLSAPAAYIQAWVLRCYGAEARVIRSNPVTWPEENNPNEED